VDSGAPFGGDNALPGPALSRWRALVIEMPQVAAHGRDVEAVVLLLQGVVMPGVVVGRSWFRVPWVGCSAAREKEEEREGTIAQERSWKKPCMGTRVALLGTHGRTPF
jgi:hypothetical protein